MTPRNLHIPIGPAGVEYSQIPTATWDEDTAANGVSLDRTELTKKRVVLLCIRAKTANERIEWSRTIQTGEEDATTVSGDNTFEYERAANYGAAHYPEWDGATPPPWVGLFNPDSSISFVQPFWKLAGESGFDGRVGPVCLIHKSKFYVITGYTLYAGSADGDNGTASGMTLSPPPDNATDISCTVSFTDNSVKIEARLVAEDSIEGEEGEPDIVTTETIESTYTFTITSLYDP